MFIQLPEEVKAILLRLTDQGFDAYLIGGVRDLLLGLTPNDWDIATAARPEDIKRIFSDCKTALSGERFGTVTVIGKNTVIDITTFRKEGKYLDHRHPAEVEFTDNFSDDLRRRDFTVNAIAYHPSKGFVDFFCGKRDLRKKLIRAIGNAEDRFEEDAVRILRALRFASTLGFEIEEKTKNAIHAKKHLLSEIAPERIQTEFVRMLCGKNIQKVLTEFYDVIGVFIPELLPTVGFSPRSPFHQFDVWQHTVHAVAYSAPIPAIRTTLFFHDLSKPDCFTLDANGRGHFYAHPKKSAVMAEGILKRLRFPQKFISDVTELIRYHDSHPSSEEDIKVLLGAIGPRLFWQLTSVMEADILAHSRITVKKRLIRLKELKTHARKILARGDCYSLSRLAIDGGDLIQMGYEGREIGIVLQKVLNEVIAGKIENNKEVILEKLKNSRS